MRAQAASIAIAGCAACIAGCFGDRGLAIEVDVGATGATRVELYVGKVRCDSNTADVDCSSLAPPDGAVALRGDIWFRDDPLPYSAPVKGRTATFQLRTTDAVTIPIIVAVGMATAAQGERAVGSATLRDVAIPIHSARIDTATLVAAGAVVGRPLDTKNLTEDRVQVWTKQVPASSCVVVEHWEAGQVTRDFVVPAEDPDCDDVKLECNPMAWHATSPAGLSRPDCFASGGSGACVVASHACADDGPRTGTCAPQPQQVCVPDKFCGCNVDGTCTQAAIDNLTYMTPRIDCVVPARTVPVGLALCPGSNTTTIDLGPLLPARCEQPVLGSLQLTGFGMTHSFGGATIELSSPAPACSFAITWKSDPRTSPDAVDDHGLIRVPFGDSALLLPIVLHFVVKTCAVADAFVCQVDGNTADPMWSCGH